jgi:chromosome segregation ATPase
MLAIMGATLGVAFSGGVTFSHNQDAVLQAQRDITDIKAELEEHTRTLKDQDSKLAAIKQNLDDIRDILNPQTIVKGSGDGTVR